MSKKDEPGSSGSESLNKYNAIVPKNFRGASAEQKNVGSAGSLGGPRDLYLTNTDNSPSPPVKNESDFQRESFDFYLETMDLYRTNKKILQQEHRLGLRRIKFVNSDNISIYQPFRKNTSSGGWGLACKTSNSVKANCASRQDAFEKILANADIWAYFVTFTFDGTKQDRDNFNQLHSRITKFLRRRKILYCLVPELHKKGGIHYHGLVSREIEPFLSDFADTAPDALKNPRIAHELALGHEIKNCADIGSTYGYTTVSPIRNSDACAHYVTKYILKTFEDPNFTRISRRRYFMSIGLKTPRVILPSEIDLENFVLSGLSGHIRKAYLKRESYSLNSLQAESGDSERGEPSGAQAPSPEPLSP